MPAWVKKPGPQLTRLFYQPFSNPKDKSKDKESEIVTVCPVNKEYKNYLPLPQPIKNGTY